MKRRLNSSVEIWLVHDSTRVMASPVVLTGYNHNIRRP